MYILLLFSLLMNTLMFNLAAMNLPKRVLLKSNDRKTISIDKKHFSDSFLKKHSAKILSDGHLILNYPGSLIVAAGSTFVAYAKTKSTTNLYDKAITELFKRQNLDIDPFNLEQVNHYLKILKWLMPPNECIDHVVSLCARLTKTQSRKEFYEKFVIENLEPLVSQVPSMSLDEEEETEQRNVTAEINKDLEKMLSQKAFDKRKLALKLVAVYQNSEEDSLIPNVLDAQSRRDCELLCGPKSAPLCSLAAKIDRTSTEVGKVLLYAQLSQPTADRDHLVSLRSKVEDLISSNYYYELKELLQEVKTTKCENSILSLWSEDPFYNYLKSQEINIHRWKELSAWFNTNECFLEVTQGGSHLYLRIQNEMSKTALSYPIKIGNIGGINENEDVKDFLALVVNPLTQKILPTLLATYGGQYASLAYLLPLLSTKHEEALAEIICIHLALQKNLMAIARYIDIIRKIQSIVQEANLGHHFPLLSALNLKAHHAQDLFLSRLWSKFTVVDSFNDLLGILETSLFKAQKPSESYPGRVIAAYRLVHKYKKQILPAIIALSEFDMYMSIAQLSQEKYLPYEEAYALFNRIMLENQHMLNDVFSSYKLDTIVDDEMKKHESPNETKFCFPELSLSDQGPSLAFEGFWNPLVHTSGKDFVRKAETTSAVVNSLELGGDMYPRNVIITGPNGGGKSTIMKAALLAVILAQSIGIAPAQLMKFTPFAKICAYLNITDDIAAGASLFNAAALRAAKLLKKVENVPDGQMSLTVFDELFNGTSPREGQALAYALIKEIGTKLHNICILTTHFHYITKLEEEDANNFVNYQVSAEIDQIGDHTQITYPYKLEPGISRQCIAFHVLRTKGLPETLLQEAERVLQELDELEEALLAPQNLPDDEQAPEEAKGQEEGEQASHEFNDLEERLLALKKRYC